MKRILIGVQARSGSTRLKGKCSLPVGEDTLAGHVITQGQRAADWLKTIGDITVSMLIPEGDPLRRRFGKKCEVFEGSELDVLQRYVDATENYNADYVVRLTGDCAWMTSQMITKCVRDAFKYKADYCSNILVRTFMEGLDVEVISSDLLDVLNFMASRDSPHREHVTSQIPDLLAEGKLDQFTFHTVMSEYDFSHIKTSIDTAAEYDECNALYARRKQKKMRAMMYGSISN